MYSPLQAYRLDIVGSLVGILAFSALSFLWAPPLAWGAVVTVLFALLLPVRRRWLLQGAALAAMLVFLGAETFTARFSWSPYYKITTTRTSATSVNIEVDGIPHQDTANVLSPTQLAGFSVAVPGRRSAQPAQRCARRRRRQRQ